jgi:predicted Zn-dependent protease
MRKCVLLLAAAAVAITPAAAQPQHYLDPRDVAEAQRDHADMVQEFGGPEQGPRAAYVETVGRKVGAYSGVAQSWQALHFTMLNSAVENAFSVPGGYVYITRQLMTLMDDESQLAFALGHEVAHIAANHARSREAYARRNPLGAMGRILSSVFGDRFFGSMLQQRAQLETLSFSREQEYQADRLGMSYMISAGYDPAGASGVLSAISRASAIEARAQGRSNRRIPEWASTHPASHNRAAQALQDASATRRLGQGIRNRDGFLARLEGIYVDDDPAQGVIDGPTFTHPDLAIQFTVPAGNMMANGTRAVTISGSAGKAQFRAAPRGVRLDEAVGYAYQQVTGGQYRFQLPPLQRTTINGMPAAMASIPLRTRSGVVDVSVAAYQWDPQRIYYFIMLTPGGYGMRTFIPMVNSLRKISQQEAAAIRPRIIDVVTVGPGDTLQSLAGRMAYRDLKMDRFLALNGLAPNARLVPGQKVKLIVYGARRA